MFGARENDVVCRWIGNKILPDSDLLKFENPLLEAEKKSKC